ncbi:double zinc ribbon protein [Balneicella halophila]|uniref:Double zinc ribbon protein n=1 Tax=Balneicella halophila TaxID=1537566 RepID=A0A7L4UNA6_BALHA|nr:CFI-box-CTERM domain-containing protein [Balneicella halophila]PVX50114.1 double zinc ribbon protein [Balneicella halophila]
MTQYNHTIGCPKCSSTQLATNKKGFSGKKAVAGAVLTGGIGLLAGTIGGNKIKITCLSCGNQFKPGEGKKILSTEKLIVKKKTPVSLVSNSEYNRIKCSSCMTENFLNHIYCKKCGKGLDKKDEKTFSDIKVKLFACPSCKNLAPQDGKICPHCKTSINYSKEGCFIATACFGDYNASEVIILRKYRDEILNQSTIGKLFIKSYYAVSPPIAKVVSKSDLLKNKIRNNLLKPLIYRIETKNTKR